MKPSLARVNVSVTEDDLSGAVRFLHEILLAPVVETSLVHGVTLHSLTAAPQWYEGSELGSQGLPLLQALDGVDPPGQLSLHPLHYWLAGFSPSPRLHWRCEACLGCLAHYWAGDFSIVRTDQRTDHRTN